MKSNPTERNDIMEEVYVVMDEGDGTIIGVFTSKIGAERGIMRCALELDDCSVLQINKEESNYDPRCTYYRIDYKEFSITETRLQDYPDGWSFFLLGGFRRVIFEMDYRLIPSGPLPHKFVIFIVFTNFIWLF